MYKKVTTIAQKVTSVILTLRVLILTRSIRVPVARASKEMVLIARVSLNFVFSFKFDILLLFFSNQIILYAHITSNQKKILFF